MYRLQADVSHEGAGASMSVLVPFSVTLAGCIELTAITHTCYTSIWKLTVIIKMDDIASDILLVVLKRMIRTRVEAHLVFPPDIVNVYTKY